jgi:hypothetical protein
VVALYLKIVERFAGIKSILGACVMPSSIAEDWRKRFRFIREGANVRLA